MKTTIEILGSASANNSRILIALRDTAAHELRCFPEFWEFPTSSRAARLLIDTCQNELDDFPFFPDPSGNAPCYI